MSLLFVREALVALLVKEKCELSTSALALMADMGVDSLKDFLTVKSSLRGATVLFS